MEELKKKVEALLFSAGTKLEFEEIRRLCRAKEDELKQVLEELKKEINDKDSSLMLVEEANSWKLTVRERYLNIVRKIVSQTELSKSIMETLAVIAWKYPVLQSEVIKIRTNKAYDHLNELEELGYISRQKYGRTKLIKLTQKFFDYFDLPPDKLKEVFKDFSQIATAIQKQEDEIEQAKQEKQEPSQSIDSMGSAEEPESTEQAISEPMKQTDQNYEHPAETSEPGIEIDESPEIDLIDSEGKKEKLEVYDEPEQETVELAVEKIGNLTIVDESYQESPDESGESIEPKRMDDNHSEETKVQDLQSEVNSDKNAEEKTTEEGEETQKTAGEETRSEKENGTAR
jgi:segregation and condensation protein B